MFSIADTEQNIKQEHLSELDKATRKFVFDQMEFEDRNLFSSCDFYGLEIYRRGKDNWGVYVRYSDKDQKKGYTLDFEDKFASCVHFNGTQLWRVELDASTSISHCAVEHFKNFLLFRQNSIKELVLCGISMEDLDFGVNSLERLEKLIIDGDVNIDQFLRKIRHPLNELQVQKKDYAIDLSFCEQVYQVRDYLNTPCLKLNNDQFLALSAQRVHISIGDLTSENIANFIINWQKKKMDPTKCQEYKWDLDDSNFDANRLLDLLGIDDRKEKINIKSVICEKRWANLFCTKNLIRFTYEYIEPTPIVPMPERYMSPRRYQKWLQRKAKKLAENAPEADASVKEETADSAPLVKQEPEP